MSAVAHHQSDPLIEIDPAALLSNIMENAAIGFVIMTFGGPFDCVGIGGAAFAAPDMHQTPGNQAEENQTAIPRWQREQRPEARGINANHDTRRIRR